MTRMWMIAPKLLCSFDPLNPKVSHLLGEHKEVHQAHGSIKKQLSIDGYINQRLIEPIAIKQRHAELVEEMQRRGYNHNSPLTKLCNMSHLSSQQRKTKILKSQSMCELIKRCPACRQRIGNYLFEKHKKIIFKRANAWSKHHACNRNICLSFDDLVSIGNEVFTICIDGWDWRKGQFSTFLWSSLDNRYHMEMGYKKHRMDDINDHPVFVGGNGDSVESQVLFYQRLINLSDNAKHVINSAINTPIELINHALSETNNVRISKRRIQRYLTEEENWPILWSWKAFDEIKQALAD